MLCQKHFNRLPLILRFIGQTGQNASVVEILCVFFFFLILTDNLLTICTHLHESDHERSAYKRKRINGFLCALFPLYTFRIAPISSVRLCVVSFVMLIWILKCFIEYKTVLVHGKDITKQYCKFVGIIYFHFHGRVFCPHTLLYSVCVACVRMCVCSFSCIDLRWCFTKYVGTDFLYLS